MNKIVVALAALFASAIFAPAAQADCSDPDDAADVAQCVRGAMKLPGMRQALPPAGRSSAAIKSECDADDADELKDCLRRLKMPNAGQLPPPRARPAAEAPLQQKKPDRVEAATPAPSPAVASAEQPAKLAAPEEPSLCQKYFPNIGKMVSVPCPAKRAGAGEASACQKYFPNIDQMVTVPCSE